MLLLVLRTLSAVLGIIFGVTTGSALVLTFFPQWVDARGQFVAEGILLVAAITLVAVWLARRIWKIALVVIVVAYLLAGFEGVVMVFRFFGLA